MRLLRASCVAGLAMVLGIASADGKKAGPQVEVMGVRVAKCYGDPFKGGLQPFSAMEGTSVAVLVTIPQGGIIALEKDSSVLESLTDDKGTNLLKEKEEKKIHFRRSNFGAFPKVSKDKKSCMLEVEGPRTPAKGASVIKAKGKLVFNCATRKKVFTQKDVKFEKGTKIKAGEIPFEIEKVGKPNWGDEPLQITLKTSQDCTNISSIRFFDKKGEDLEAKPGSSSTMRMNQMITVQRGFKFKEKIDSATIAIEYWMDLKTIEVPFDVEASVGL